MRSVFLMCSFSGKLSRYQLKYYVKFTLEIKNVAVDGVSWSFVDFLSVMRRLLFLVYFIYLFIYLLYFIIIFFCGVAVFKAPLCPPRFVLIHYSPLQLLATLY